MHNISEEQEEGEEVEPPQDQEEVCAAFRVLQAVVTLAQGTLNVRTYILTYGHR